jgi:penicillin-binding protein 1C
MKRIAAALLLACAGTAQALPSFDEVKSGYASSEALLLDRHGEPVHRLRTDMLARRGRWVPLADVSPALRNAMVLSEDRRFYEHSGVDWQAASAAAWGNLFNRRTRGASTLTMQLAGLLEDGAAPVSRRGVVGKVGQAVAARVLDRRWRKDQVLEAYLNLVAYRGEVEGIDALSRTLFGKAPHGLDEREAAIAAALVRGPNAKARVVSRRACGVLQAMRAGSSCDGLDTRVEAALQRRAWEPSEGIAPHLATRLLAPADDADRPRELRSSLSARVQRHALELLQRHLRELRGRNVADGAVVVLDNATGEVLAYVGSPGLAGSAAQTDAVTAPRQTGSTLKPFLYALAIAERRVTAASLLEDSPAQLPTASGLYIPQNYDRQFKGWVSVRTALAASLNVPAVRTITMVSPDALHRQLRALDVPLKETGGWYGYSLALGSADVDLLHMANAYRTLANGGRASAVSFTPGARPAFRQALDARAAFIVGDILADPHARARTFGVDSVLATRFWTAVKTGTSKDMRDNWALGWSRDYTVGVWVGNASGAPMWNVSGTSGAAPVWAGVMRFLHRGRPSPAPSPPAGVVARHTQYAQGSEAPRQEWFVAGTEQGVVAEAGAEGAASAAAAIVSPAPGTIVALDPDIPPRHQRVQLQATGRNVRWQVDGKPVAAGNRAEWFPWPGRHVLRLTDARGQLLDEVRIEVRGAGAGAVSRIPRPEK